MVLLYVYSKLFIQIKALHRAPEMVMLVVFKLETVISSSTSTIHSMTQIVLDDLSFLKGGDYKYF